MLVFEPEAAALYCRFQKMQNISNAKDNSNLSKKKKMLVFDMGGIGPITFSCQYYLIVITMLNCTNLCKLSQHKYANFATFESNIRYNDYFLLTKNLHY